MWLLLCHRKYMYFSSTTTKNTCFLTTLILKILQHRFLITFLPMWQKYPTSQTYFLIISVDVMDLITIFKIIHTTFAPYKYLCLGHYFWDGNECMEHTSVEYQNNFRRIIPNSLLKTRLYCWEMFRWWDHFFCMIVSFREHLYIVIIL